MSRLAHEIAYVANPQPFLAYYEKQMPARLVQRIRAKIYKEVAGICCNYPSHKYHVDCPNQCEINFIRTVSSLNNIETRELLQKSVSLKTIYLEIVRDYEYTNNIVINDNNA